MFVSIITYNRLIFFNNLSPYVLRFNFPRRKVKGDRYFRRYESTKFMYLLAAEFGDDEDDK